MRAPHTVLLLLVVLALGAMLSPASADVIHLRTGEAVKGRPLQERSNDNVLAVEDYLSGALRRFSWEVVDPIDRDRIQERWGWKNSGQGIVMGERIVIGLAGGGTEEIFGVVQSEDDRVIRVMRNGQIVEVPKAQLQTRDEEEMDARRVWNPEQLYDRQVEAMKAEPNVDFENLGPHEHWRLAEWSFWAENYEKAREHYLACESFPEFLKRDLAAARRGKAEALLADQAANDTLRDARMKLNMNLFSRVRDILDGFAEKHPEASEAATAKLDHLREEFNEKRTRHFQTQARRYFPRIVEDLIESKVREKDIGITDVTSWTRRELPDEAFERLAEKYMRRNDASVTAEEARTFWEGRQKKGWRRVTYGAGTFIIEKPQIKPPQRRSGGGGSGRGGGAGPRVEIPKPPTRDQWWEDAGSRERTQWVFAYFIERSELFELGDREIKPCLMCHGVGLLTKNLQTGDVLAYLCVRCGGAQNDIIVKYR